MIFSYSQLKRIRVDTPVMALAIFDGSEWATRPRFQMYRSIFIDAVNDIPRARTWKLEGEKYGVSLERARQVWLTMQTLAKRMMSADYWEQSVAVYEIDSEMIRRRNR